MEDAWTRTCPLTKNDVSYILLQKLQLFFLSLPNKRTDISNTLFEYWYGTCLEVVTGGGQEIFYSPIYLFLA